MGLSIEKSSIEQEKNGLREEMVRVEDEKLDLESEKSGRLGVIRIKHKTFTHLYCMNRLCSLRTE